MPVNPNQMSPEETADLFTRAGGQTVTALDIGKHVEAGAPTNADGTLHLASYVKWLVSEASRLGY